jgi:hypothetical protein
VGIAGFEVGVDWEVDGGGDGGDVFERHVAGTAQSASGRPWVKEKPELVVARALNPSERR